MTLTSHLQLVRAPVGSSFSLIGVHIDFLSVSPLIQLSVMTFTDSSYSDINVARSINSPEVKNGLPHV